MPHKVAIVVGLMIALSIWVGFQIGTERDSLAWLFYLGIPAALVAFLVLSAKRGQSTTAELSALNQKVDALTRRVEALEGRGNPNAKRMME